MLEASRPWSMKGKSQRCATAKPRFIVQSLPNNFVMDESFPAINAAIIPRMAVSASPTANKSTLFESSTNSKKATPRQGTAKSVVLMEPNNAIITSSMDSTGLYVGSAIIEKRPDFKFRGVSARTDAKRPVTSEAILFPRIQRMQHRVKELEGFIVEDINYELEGLSDLQRDVVLEVLHRNEKVKIRSTSGGGQQQQQKSLEKTKRAESSSSFAGSYSGSHFSSDDSGSIGAFYEEEDDDDLSIISFPIDDYEEQGNADSTNLKEKETEINMFENLTNYTMEVKVKPAREKYDKLINPIKQTLMAANALRNNTDLSDTDFQSEMRKVTNDLKDWIVHSLEVPANLEDYMNFFNMNPGHATQLPPNLFHQNILNAQKQVRNLVGENNTHGTDQTGGGKVIMTDEEAARRAVEAQGFIGELEAILNTWRPIYFDNKRGRRLNVVSDRSAPKHLIKSLNESLGVEVDPLQSDVDYDHIDTFKESELKKYKLFERKKRMRFGPWYVEPEKWAEVHSMMFKSKNLGQKKKKGTKSFIEKWCDETRKNREKEDADILAGRDKKRHMNPNAMRQQQRNNSNSPHQDEKRNRHIPLLSGATKHGVMINNSGHNATGISARPSVAVAVARNGVGLGTGAVDRRSSVSRNSTSLCPLSPLKPSINSSMRSISSNHQEDNDDQDED